MKHYVYELIDPRNNEVFYIGKGCRNRLKDHVCHVKNEQLSYKKKNPHKYNKINSILEDGYNDIKYNKKFITEDENEAFDKEEKFISEYGLENLTNICPGGDGGYNPKAKRINSEIRSGSTWEEIYGEEKAKEIKRSGAKTFPEKKIRFMACLSRKYMEKKKQIGFEKNFQNKLKKCLKESL